MKKAYTGSILNPLNKHKTEFIKDGVLLVDGSIIKNVGKYEDLKNSLEGYDIIDCKNKIICPGFIDTHLHIPQVDQRARFGHSLLDWLQKHIYKAEEAFGEPSIAKLMSNRFFDEMIKNGTTTCLAFSSYSKSATDTAFEVAKARGVRAIIGKVMMDFSHTSAPPETTENSVRDSIELCEKWHNTQDGLLQYAFTPRFAPTCTRELMQQVSVASEKSGALIQSHLSENEEEIQVVLKMFPECKTYTEVYHKYGCLNERTVMAHCIHMSEKELKLFKDCGATIAHCPSSNFYLKSGAMKLTRIEYHDITMGLGSDVGAGPSFSIFDVMKAMNFMQPFPIQPQKCFYYSTLGGAEVLKLDQKIGNLVPGKEADFVVMDIKKCYPYFSLNTIDDLLAFMIYLGNREIIDQVYVRGNQIYPY